jgi:hypothetical protein
MPAAEYIAKCTRWSLSLLLILTLSACAVHLVSSYDEVFDRAATDTQKKIVLLFEELKRPASPARQYRNSPGTYADIGADLHTLRVRAQANTVGAPNSETVAIVDSISQNMRLVEEQHRRKPAGPSVAFLETAEDQIDLQFLALIQLEIAKRR